MNVSPQRLLRILASFAILVGTTCILGLLAIGVTAFAYRNSYYPGVVVGGISVAGQSRDTAKALLAAEKARLLALPVSVSVSTDGDTTLQTTLGEIGVTLSTDTAEETAWNIGRTVSAQSIYDATVALFSGAQIPVSYTVTKEGLQVYTETVILEQVRRPQPASLSVSGSTVTLVADVAGETVIQDELHARVAEMVPSVLQSGSGSVVVPLKEVAAVPSALTLQPLADELKALADTRISLVAGSRTLYPDKATILSWFTTVQSDTGDVSIAVDSAAVDKYLRAQSASLGIVIAQATDQVKAVLVTLLASGTTAPFPSQRLTIATKPVVVTPTIQPVLDRFAGKYVEVVLAAQQAFAIENGQIVATYRVSTGKWSTPTPKGTFTITSKHPRAFSRTYGLYMPYWQNFIGTTDGGEELRTGEYGLHELPEWPSGYKEGEAHLGTAVSHGCVRFGVGDAKAMYDFTEIGTPVVVY